MSSGPLPRPGYSGDLPIHERREDIIRAIRDNPVVVIAGETGSGKTTQIPKFLLDCGFGAKGLIGCTQPRRVAALSVARRIAEELNVNYGREVGSKIRFTDETSDATVIKLMTDGILLNEIQNDPDLRRYEAIVIDEAHERSLNIDFILGFLRQLIGRRKDLKLVITSATIDTATFSKAFGNAPVIEVSGRMYPVETRYRPIEAMQEEAGDLTYIEAAAEVIGEILAGNREGDILAFLPGERDIHELRRLLEKGPARSCDLLPLFGRLANADQQRIFHPGGRRRIILSTNIAETSLTVPGIRFVVDTGLARMSHYSPHSRTQRLPIEPVAQSSAEQRKGRCGRVADGICYRLYSEEDFLSRPVFTTPEILRSNLAAVILRMLAFGMGEVRAFPFIEPPAENAIRGGYRLLAELGAVEAGDEETGEGFRLTQIGHQLARIPVDPTVGRMLLQAVEENVVESVLVIAAGLSIRDPRERPSEFAKEADEMQRRFVHKESDFLTLLNIWDAYHDEMDRLSQGQLRKFCKSHYLAYQRMREWRDIHHQLERILKDLKLRPASRAAGNTTPDPQAIHRAILAGLLSNVAVKEAGHDYQGTRNRKAMLFPGSGLFDHEAAKKQRKAAYAKKGKPAPAKTSAPDWIVCGEFMETGRLYARTAAKIDPQWILDLAGPLLQVKHSEAFWSTKSAAVLCRERKVLFGLEIARDDVSYSRINPKEATAIFVRNGLVEEGIRERPAFLKSNAELRREAESEWARRRLGSSLAVDDRLHRFYEERLDGVGSFAELRAFAKRHHGGSMDFLQARSEHLFPPGDPGDDGSAFPRSLEIGGSSLPLEYRHTPGEESDGVTLKVPLGQVDALGEGTLDWAVPGHLEEKIESLLRGLPKRVRVALHPLKERAAEIRVKLRPSAQPLREQLAEVLRTEYGITTYRDEWTAADIPDHLKPRIEIVDTQGETIAAARGLESLHGKLEELTAIAASSGGMETLPAWRKAATRIEKQDLHDWTFPDPPESIDLSGDAKLPLQAWPALVLDGDSVHLRLLRSKSEAAQATRTAWPVLGEKALGRDGAWVRRELKDLKALGPLLLPLGGWERVRDEAWPHLLRHLFPAAEIALRGSAFREALATARERQRGIIPLLADRLRELLEQRQAASLILEQKKTPKAISFPGMRAELESLAPPDLFRRFEFDELPDLARFLRAMVVRAERAKENIRRDMEKSKRVAPWESALADLQKAARNPTHAHRVREFFFLLEEFRVSVYAQELGTGQKVSEKRLEMLRDDISEAIRASF